MWTGLGLDGVLAGKRCGCCCWSAAVGVGLGVEAWGRGGVCMLRGSAGYRNARRDSAVGMAAVGGTVDWLHWWPGGEWFVVEALTVARGMALA